MSQPLRIDLASPHLTQGALLHSRILIADPPSPSTIKSIRLYIAPTYRAKYLEEARPPLQPAEQVNLGRVERGRGEPLLSNKVEIGENIDLGASWRRDATFRMPTGDELWPSTLPGSDTRMNVQHNLVIELVFTPKGRKATKLTLDTPVTIFSVCFFTRACGGTLTISLAVYHCAGGLDAVAGLRAQFVERCGEKTYSRR